MKIQRFNPNIRNFSKALHAFLYQEHIVDLLPECGWLCGGCRSLMKAMQIWLGEGNAIPYLIVKRREDQHAEHAIVKVGSYFLDGDGVSTHNALYKRWRYVERLPRVFIRPFAPDKEPAHRYGEAPFYIEDKLIEKLAVLISEQFDRIKVLELLGRIVKQDL